MTRLIPLLCLALFPLWAAAAERHRSWGDVDHWAGVFDDPARDEWQMPITVIDFLGVELGEVVADLGAGTGYFTGPFSAQVSETGKIYAVDIEQAMLDHIMAREDVNTDWVVPILAKKNDPKLPAGEVDLVLVVNTWHHISKRDKYLEKIHAGLSPEGRVAIIDFREGELPVGPPPEQKLSRAEVVEEFESASWRLVAESVALPYQYLLVFRPPAQPDTRKFVNP